MIRTEIAADLRPLDNLLGFARNHPRRVKAAADRAFALPQGKPALVSPKYLGSEPEPPSHPFVWSTDATKNANARRMYFYLVNAGLIKTDGERYERTHGLSQGYDGGVFLDGLSVMISITNKANRAHLYSKGRRQVPGHILWGKDAPVVARWLVDWRPYLIAELRAEATAEN